MQQFHSWGSRPQHREFQYEIPRTKQVGVRAQHREFQYEIPRTRQVGVLE
ncbi:PTS cellobiose transporter subunit IIBC [Staphylococcus epidermidis]|nr:PTS cellobiose transporter subunit IIBC [Staphylococcus epidermidis]PJM54241.1 PTS cellobiose transporter subunit IIBC [Staphylococcus epidermidis]